jgi:hypothetical protein
MRRSAPHLLLAAALGLSCTQRSAVAPAAATGAAPSASPPASTLPGIEAGAIAPARRQTIRNAELALEVDDPARAQQRAIAVVERLHGFALSSDASSTGGDARPAELRISLLLRVPAEAFDLALGELRQLGRGAGREQVSGQDVTEAYIDLEARIRTQRALESQLLEILKGTKAVSEMMEVHARLAEVRGEIEKMEGRLRFLDNQTSLSTIRLEIAGPGARRGPGFGDSVRRAAGDMVAVASAIVNGAIRLVGVSAPVIVMLGVPGWAILRAVRRRK